MLPDVICTCPKTFPARQKQENANAKATRNLRIKHPPRLLLFCTLTTWLTKTLQRDDCVSIGSAPRATNNITLRLDSSRSKYKFVEIPRPRKPRWLHARSDGSISAS